LLRYSRVRERKWLLYVSVSRLLSQISHLTSRKHQQQTKKARRKKERKKERRERKTAFIKVTEGESRGM